MVTAQAAANEMTVAEHAELKANVGALERANGELNRQVKGAGGLIGVSADGARRAVAAGKEAETLIATTRQRLDKICLKVATTSTPSSISLVSRHLTHLAKTLHHHDRAVFHFSLCFLCPR